MKHQKTLSRILDGLILLVFILFFSSAGFQDRNTSGWYQQWFPNLNGSTIKDITFLDSLTGFAVTDTPTPSIYSYILKTINGGDNWVINYNSSSTWGFRRIIYTDSNTIFAVRSYTEILKTTNRGNNWQIIPMSVFCDDISILNKDTMLAVNSNPPEGGIYRTTNGGITWSLIWTNGSNGNPNKIYMYDKNMGFSCDVSSISHFRKTTNGGFNWFEINPTDDFLDIKFIDTLTGWKGTNSIQKTTDGGITWFLQTPPNVYSFIVRSISIINKDTVWLGGGSAKIIGNTFYGALCKTTNGGLNWGYQIPNMAVDSGRYDKVDFVNKNNGWAYINETGFNDGVHTKVGGNDSTVYTGIINNVRNIITDYKLFQNYPNPFNNSTIINYQLTNTNHVKIRIFNINGREVSVLVNDKKNAGYYSVTFNGNNLSSGIYFYSMTIDGKVLGTKRMTLLK